jgi:hypothetical protein
MTDLTTSSTASQRLMAENKPTGKVGSPGLTIKLRNQYTAYRSENPDTTKSWEEWLQENGYGLGDNNHAYKT